MARITFNYYNSYDDTFLGSASLDYNRTKAKNGFYTRWWRIWKPALAKINKLDKHWVRAKIVMSGHEFLNVQNQNAKRSNNENAK